jgi:tRNA A37 threonylcarbamoyladenosine synthetase subunit TsaC/SUA5/YrdC
MSELVTLLAVQGTPAAVSLTTDEVAARLTDELGSPVSTTTADLYALPSRSDAPDAAQAFGVDPTALADGLRALARMASAEG